MTKHSSPIWIVLLAGILMGCTNNTYRSTSEALQKSDSTSSYSGYDYFWVQVAGADDPKDMSGQDSLDACIKSLSGKFPQPPSSVVRAVQIADCMNGHGWEFKALEYIIVR